MIKQISQRLQDFFIPPLCIVCDETLNGDKWLCQSCLSKLKNNNAGRDPCPRCSGNRNHHECACEFAWDFPFDRAFAVYDYDDIVGAIARHIKYKGKRKLARYMGRVSAPLVPQSFLDGMDIVIPVPLHKARQRRRGYNQAEALAIGFLEGLETGVVGISYSGDTKNTLSVPVLRIDILKRIKNTTTQTKLDRKDRLKNLTGAFAVNKQTLGELKGKRVILADDVLTTGATVEECTNELLRNGCAEVRVLAMGRGGQ